MPEKLQRHIGLGSLVLYGLGDILGAGIYGLVGKAADQMGQAIWLAFLVSMLAAGFTGLSYASLGSRYPRAGGAAYVTHRAFGKPFLAYLIGLAVLASGLTSMATACRAFSGYFIGLFPNLPLELVIVGFALMLAGIIFRGIRETLWMNNLLTVIEVTGLALVILVGVKYIGGVDYLDASTPNNPTGQLNFSLIFGGAVLTFYSFIGFEDMLNISEEVKEPERNIPRGLLLAVFLSSVIYMIISLIAVSVIPAAQLAQSKQPLVDVVKTAAPWFPTPLFSLIALFAVANTALLNYVMGSRLLYGMAHQGLLPKFLGRLHPQRSTPHLAIAVIFVILMILVASGDISALAKATSVLLLLSFTMVNLSLIVLKKKDKNPGRFEVPSWVPAAGAFVCVLMLSQAQSKELLISGAILGGITGLYFVLRPKDSQIQKIDT